MAKGRRPTVGAGCRRPDDPSILRRKGHPYTTRPAPKQIHASDHPPLSAWAALPFRLAGAYAAVGTLARSGAAWLTRAGKKAIRRHCQSSGLLTGDVRERCLLMSCLRTILGHETVMAGRCGSARGMPASRLYHGR